MTNLFSSHNFPIIINDAAGLREKFHQQAERDLRRTQFYCPLRVVSIVEDSGGIASDKKTKILSVTEK